MDENKISPARSAVARMLRELAGEHRGSAEGA